MSAVSLSCLSWPSCPSCPDHLLSDSSRICEWPAWSRMPISIPSQITVDCKSVHFPTVCALFHDIDNVIFFSRLDIIDSTYKGIADLNFKLRKIREENSRHSQVQIDDNFQYCILIPIQWHPQFFKEMLCSKTSISVFSFMFSISALLPEGAFQMSTHF